MPGGSSTLHAAASWTALDEVVDASDEIVERLALDRDCKTHSSASLREMFTVASAPGAPGKRDHETSDAGHDPEQVPFSGYRERRPERTGSEAVADDGGRRSIRPQSL
jgi:hypothetical protein